MQEMRSSRPSEGTAIDRTDANARREAAAPFPTLQPKTPLPPKVAAVDPLEPFVVTTIRLRKDQWDALRRLALERAMTRGRGKPGREVRARRVRTVGSATAYPAFAPGGIVLRRIRHGSSSLRTSEGRTCSNPGASYACTSGGRFPA